VEDGVKMLGDEEKGKCGGVGGGGEEREGRGKGRVWRKGCGAGGRAMRGWGSCRKDCNFGVGGQVRVC